MKLELLAPARDLTCGKAAIDHGADAVYIGAQHFGARAAAGNSVSDIAELCRYAHQYHAKVYVTVNTIIYDEELAAVHRLTAELQQAGADAVLVQDMALVRMTQMDTPAAAANGRSGVLPAMCALHASTQTDNRTAEKVRWLRDQGFSRVVLARELSVSEIRAIHQAVPDVELEAFVHGALCVSYSGQCYASQYCFHRSANRGECAQVCRMAFDLVDADGRVWQRDRHLLSLKDLCQIDNIEALAEAGVTSFKIEGRLKDVAYVKNVTAAYSERLNELVRRHPDRYSRASLGHCRYTFTPSLYKTFNRGYTDYFAHGRQPDIASFDTPKAMGEYVGKVKEVRRDSLTVAGTARFTNGDGLCFFAPADYQTGSRSGSAPQRSAFSDRQSSASVQRSGSDHLQPASNRLIGFRVNRAEGNRLFPQHLPAELRPGMALYRNSDQEMERLLSRPSAERKIPVAMSLSATAGGFLLQAEIVGGAVTTEHQRAEKPQRDNRVSVEMTTEHQRAEKPQRDNIVRQLSKLGNTPYECVSVNLPDGFNYFIPSSQLTELRRRVCEKLEQHMEQVRMQATEPATMQATEPATMQAKEPATIQATEPATIQKGEPAGTGSASSLPQLSRCLQSGPPAPSALDYQANIANSEACQFYGVESPTAYELKPTADAMLMQCRHCLRYALGYCVKHGGKQPAWHEPLFLRLGDGRHFRLEFDCRHCQMNVYAMPNP